MIIFLHILSFSQILNMKSNTDSKVASHPKIKTGFDEILKLKLLNKKYIKSEG